MQKDLSHILIYGLSEQPFLENFEANSKAIDELVETWHCKFYISPYQKSSVHLLWPENGQKNFM